MLVIITFPDTRGTFLDLFFQVSIFICRFSNVHKEAKGLTLWSLGKSQLHEHLEGAVVSKLSKKCKREPGNRNLLMGSGHPLIPHPTLTGGSTH